MRKDTQAGAEGMPATYINAQSAMAYRCGWCKWIGIPTHDTNSAIGIVEDVWRL